MSHILLDIRLSNLRLVKFQVRDCPYKIVRWMTHDEDQMLIKIRTLLNFDLNGT